MTTGEFSSEEHQHFSYFITKTSADKYEDPEKVASIENTFKKQVTVILDDYKFLL